MKKILIVLALFFVYTNTSFSYEVSSAEKEKVHKIIQVLDKSYAHKSEKWYNTIIKAISVQINKEDISDEKKYILEEVKLYLEVKLKLKQEYRIEIEKALQEDFTKKQEEERLLEKQEKQKQEEIKQKEISYLERREKAKVTDKIFFDTYGKDITTELKVKSNCTKYYKEIDEIAYKNNFPTELIIATWDMEYGCILGNPTNGWGPFQITSKYYQPGEITLEQFLFEVQDFIDFSKGKWNYFNTNTYVDYKQRFGSENITISYDKYTLRELRLHSILYNGITKNVTLDKGLFTNGNLNKYVVSKFDGIVTKFLKILNWKNNN